MGGNKHSKESIIEPPAEEKENYFQTKSGLWLFFHKWESEEGKEERKEEEGKEEEGKEERKEKGKEERKEKGGKRGVVFLCHGVGEYILRPGYLDFANHLTSAGFIVYGFDHQGHGKSNGERVHAPTFQSYVDHFFEFLTLKSKDHPDLPKFLFGHSMGALVTATLSLQLLQSQPTLVKAVVLSAIPVFVKVPAATKAFAKVAVNVAPKWAPAVGEKLDVNSISRNPDAIQRYIDDPLIYKGFFKVAQGNGMITIGTYLQAQAPKLSYPILFIHGSEDKISNPEGSRLMYDLSSSQDKRLQIFPGVFHEPFEDPDKEKIFDTIIQFLQRKVDNIPEPKESPSEETK